MKRSHLTWTLFTVALLAAVLPFATPAAAAPASIAGKLVSLSPATRTLTVQSADGGQVILRTNAESTLVRNGNPVTLAALALRDSVSVRYDRSSSTVLDLRANGSAHATVRGVLARATKTSLSVVTAGGPKAFAMNSSTLIARNGRAAHASDLRRGDALLIHTVAAGGAALAKDVAADGPEEDEVEGSITAIAGPDVTITPKHGAAVTVHVDADTTIKLCDGGCHAAALADLAVGMHAEAEFDPISMVAEKIEAHADDDTQALRVRGTIAAIDTTAGTVTVHPAHGSDVTVLVDADTKISRNEAPATLADLVVGDKAQAWYDGESLLASRLVASSADDDDGDDETPAPRKQLEGKVTKVSATALTVAPQRGAPVEVVLDGTTKYFVRGTPATNADVKVGNRVHVAYDRTTLVAAVVRVQNTNPHPALSNISGSVTAVSATEITITPHHGAAATLTLDATTVIKINGHTGSATDIHTGDGAQVKFDALTMVAKVLTVQHHGSHGHP